MYTLSEFRKNLRQAFLDANSGHEVVIDRAGQKYQLVSLVDKPLPGHSFESVPGGIVVGKGLSPVGISPYMEVCRVHGVPLDSRGKCLQKGCKYA